MSQADTVGPIDEAVGYMLKRAATAMRTAMEGALRPLDLTVPQYSCLEVLDQQPGLSGSELARATFVTRQSMNLVVQGLHQRGLLTRAAVADHGKALATELTDAGRGRLLAASVAVRRVEEEMLARVPADARQRLLVDLTACAEAFADPPHRPRSQ